MNDDPVVLAPPATTGFLPDLCSPVATLPLVLIAALVALALAVARAAGPGFWPEFGRLLLFCEVLTLASAAVLCLLRRLLSGARPVLLAAFAFAALLATDWVISEGAWFLLATLGVPLPRGAQARLWWVLRIVVVAAIVDALVLRYLYLGASWRENVRREAASRLAALTARIRPHFLFNTLNTAIALVAERPQDAERSLENLAELFRASLADQDSRIAFAEELAIVRRYLAIEALRLGSRLTVHWRLAPLVERALVPGFILQPLVENAVTHGIEPAAAGGSLEIRAERAGRMLELAVDNSIGADSGGEGYGIGLSGIRARLALVYGGDATLAVERSPGRFGVRLRCPWEECDADPDRG
ncbi:MAG TPA: histidine kinase [Gammaproteobacteria bacterium]|nr:histidine kinase [Gammaproteobacteria bacterium]